MHTAAEYSDPALVLSETNLEKIYKKVVEVIQKRHENISQQVLRVHLLPGLWYSWADFFEKL